VASKAFCALFLLLCLPLAAQIRIRDLTFDADFPVDTAELAAASGITQGDAYDPEAVKAAVTRIREHINKQGRYYVRMPFPEMIPVSAEELDLRFSLREEHSSESVVVRFTGLRYFTEAKLRQQLLVGNEQTFTLGKLPSLLDNILRLYHERGYLFARVMLDSLVLDENLTAWIGVNEGKVFRPERFYFEGNTHTRDETLLRISGLRDVRVITPAVLEEAVQNLLNKAYLTECVVEPIDPSSLLIKVKEGRMTFLEGVLGLNRRDGKTDLNGILRVKFLNLWGSDRAISLYWTKDPTRSLLELSYHESGVRGIPIAGDIYLHRSTQDTLWIKSKVSTQIYGYRKNHRLGLDLKSENNLYDPSFYRGPSQRTSSIGIGAFWSYSNAFPTVNPRGGLSLTALYRLINASEGKEWSGAFELDNANYIGISNRLVGAVGVHIRNLDDNSARDYDLYRMGGYNNLRGYREGEFQSWQLGWASYELRWILNRGSRFFVFFDHGLQAYKHPLADGYEKRYKTDIMGVGIGFRVQTKLGILGVDYGLGYRDKRWSGLGSGMIHAGFDLSL
jgi:outer membrane protein assembly factor BamA